MFLQTLAGARTLMSAAAWATCTLLGSQKDNRFPLSVSLHTGEQVVLSVVRLTTHLDAPSPLPTQTLHLLGGNQRAGLPYRNRADHVLEALHAHMMGHARICRSEDGQVQEEGSR